MKLHTHTKKTNAQPPKKRITHTRKKSTKHTQDVIYFLSARTSVSFLVVLVPPCWMCETRPSPWGSRSFRQPFPTSASSAPSLLWVYFQQGWHSPQSLRSLPPSRVRTSWSSTSPPTSWSSISTNRIFRRFRLLAAAPKNFSPTLFGCNSPGVAQTLCSF